MKALNQDINPNESNSLLMRIAPERHNLLKRAATLTGRSVEQFVLDSAEQAALRTIEEKHVLRLTQRDSEFLVTAMLDPSEPGERLREAVAYYQKMMGG